ncbi:MAG: hypothetical protein ACLFWB_04605 [Armatimonadota bacterium]
MSTQSTTKSDVALLRQLAKQYAEIAAKPIQDERRDLWRRHNSLKRTRPLVYVRWLAAWNEHPWSELECRDPLFRTQEKFFKQMIFQDTIGDDYIIEPWITMRASVWSPEEGHWGVPYGRIQSGEAGGAWKYDPPLKELDDIEKLVEPDHRIDEEETQRNFERLSEAIGDIVDIVVDRKPFWSHWWADLSTDLGYLRELEQVMWDMSDNPEWLHRLLSFMSQGVLKTHEQAEKAGDWRLCDHENQAMAYAGELPDPSASPEPVTRDQLWVFGAAQEFALISPDHHWEFMFQYQFPIYEKFGLVAYGCCEDLTKKIDYLRRLPNLRRIAVAPRADVAECAEQIGQDYVLSYRPNPADMICCGYDRDHVQNVIRDAMDASRGCHVDITLKDVQTVQNRPEDLRYWTRAVREVADEYA